MFNSEVAKYLLISLGLLLLLFFLVVFGFLHQAGLLHSSSKAELVENYEERKQEIEELKSFFKAQVPPGYWVYIEFKDRKTIDLWVHEAGEDRSDRPIVFREWNIQPYDYQEPPARPADTNSYDPKTRSLAEVKQLLGWSDATFRAIKTKLDRANCISVDSGDPASIGFGRSGFGKYSYTLFDAPLPDSLKADYNDSCTYLLYNDRLALEYGGGAIGPQCFPESDLK